MATITTTSTILTERTFSGDVALAKSTAAALSSSKYIFSASSTKIDAPRASTPSTVVKTVGVDVALIRRRRIVKNAGNGPIEINVSSINFYAE